MTHLFKLKKDGKTVGYCKLIKYRDPLDYNKHWRGWGFSKNGKNWGQQQISFDTAHPFVCKDKNGKDTFTDEILWFHWRGKKTKAKIVKKDFFIHLMSYGGEVRGLPRTMCSSDIPHIELIEEKS